MMIRVSTLLAALAVIGAVAEVQAQQIASRNETATVHSASTIAKNIAQPARKVAPDPEITDYPKYPVEYPADWKGPRITGPAIKPTATVKTTAKTTAFKKPSNTTRAISVSSAANTASAGAQQSSRVISQQPTHSVQPRVISPSYNRYPAFYSPSGCLTGR